jgi:hypothetical protein
MANPRLQLSGDAQRALEQFSSDFDAAFVAAEAEQWARGLALVHSSNAIKTTFPIPISAAGYQKFAGDPKFRSLYTRSITVEPDEWQDGVEEQLRIVQAPDFIGWAGEPARIAVEGRRHANRLVAEVLEGTANLSLYRDRKTGSDLGIPLFSASHPVNIFDDTYGVFDNAHDATAIDAAMFKAAFARFRQKKAANGKPMGLRLDTMYVPPELEQPAKDFLESDMLRLAILAGGSNTNELSNNRFKNAVQLVVCDEFTSATKVYLLASNGPKPIILQDGGTPKQSIFGEGSEHCMKTGRVAISYLLEMAAAAALPHSIEQITITG